MARAWLVPGARDRATRRPGSAGRRSAALLRIPASPGRRHES